MVALQNNDILVVLENTEKIATLENIDILFVTLEHILSAVKWVAEIVTKMAVQTVACISMNNAWLLHITEK